MSIRWLTVFLDLPGDGFDAAVRFWLRVTAGELSARRGPDGEFATVLPAQGDAYLRIQRVRSGVGGRHLDLHVDVAEVALADVAVRATALGAAGIPVRLLFQRRAGAEPQDAVSAHLDFAADDLPALINHHLAAGARVRARFPHWTTMADPAGQLYCLSGRDPVTGARRPTGESVGSRRPG